MDGFSPRKLRNYYLLNPEEEGERHYKLILSQTDKASLIAIVGGSEQPKERSLRVTENFALFESWIAAYKGDEEGGENGPRFWRLAQALSALYPAHTDEKCWVDGVLARKKGLGF